MAFSVNTPIGDGVTKQFAVNFTNGLFSRDNVHVFVDGEVDGLGEPVERTFTWINDGLIELNGDAPGVGVVVEIRRIMDKDAPAVDFEDGEILTEETMDRSQDHLLNSIHELLDGYGFENVQTDMSLNGNSLINVGDVEAERLIISGIELTDSVDLAERWANEDEDVIVEEGKYSAKHYSIKAEASADRVDLGALDQAVTAAELAETNSLSYSQEALYSADRAEDEADRSQSKADSSSSDADRAEAARDAALLAGDIYESTAAGLSATVDGDYFSVPSSSDGEYLTLYRNSSGSAAEIETYPSRKAVADVEEKIPDGGADGYALSVVGGDGAVAGGVKNDGTLHFKRGEFDEFELGGVDNPSFSISVDQDPDYPFNIVDSEGRIAFAIGKDGGPTSGQGSLESSAAPRIYGVYPFQNSYIINTGQSLGSGGSATDTESAITTEVEYDNKLINSTTSPTGLIDAKISSSGVEPPLYGAMGFAKEAIDKQNGVSFQDFKYQLISANTASSGATIERISKGGTDGVFERAINIAEFLSALFSSRMPTESFNAPAVLFTQGESNDQEASEVYKPKLIQLANDYNTDLKAATGQFNDVYFISYQMCSDRPGGSNRGVQIAQYEAAREVPLIHIAAPTYFMNYVDNRHIDSVSSKWLGGYYGLVYKKVVIDREAWEPLWPKNHSLNGSSVTLFFSKDNLRIDTTMVPEQPNYGFSAVDSLGNDLQIQSVDIIGGNAVRLNFSSAPDAGSKLRYGFGNAVGMGIYYGPAGNLRDNAGDHLVYEKINKPMHNWCLVFELEI